MRSQRILRLLTAGVLIAGASLAIPGSAPASLAATPAMLALFTWTGAGADDSFGTHCNWHPAPSCNFGSPRPDGTDDSATFPTNGGTAWAVDLIDETIFKVTVNEDVDFDGDGDAVTLNLAEFNLDGGSGGITVTWTADAHIK